MLFRYLATFVSVVLIFGTAGCTTTQVAPDYKLETSSDTGVVVFSLAHDAAGGDRTEAIVYLDGGLGLGGTHYKSAEKPLVGFGRPSDFSGAFGHLHVVTLPVGKHEFTSWQIFNGTGLRIFPTTHPPHLAFEVKAGEVVYLGAFHGHLRRGKNIFGIEITGDGVVALSDAHNRDLPLLIKRYPQFEGKVRTDLLPIGVWANSADTSPKLDLALPPPKSL